MKIAKSPAKEPEISIAGAPAHSGGFEITRRSEGSHRLG